MRVQLDTEDAEIIAAKVAELLAAAQPSASPWMTSDEAREYLRLPSLDALHRLTGSGAVPHVKQGGRCLFHRGQLDEWLDGHYAGPVKLPDAVSKSFPRPRKAA